VNDISTTVRNLAAIAAAKKLLADAEAREKAALSSLVIRGTNYAYTADRQELGYATVPKPSRGKPHVVVTDEAQMLAWMVDEFGEDIVETKVQLTEQGRKSLEEFALAEHEESGSPDYFDLPGVSVTVPPAKTPVPRFTPAKNVVELVQGMVRSGELSLTEVLALESGER
jgi:hypothetical protein